MLSQGAKYRDFIVIEPRPKICEFSGDFTKKTCNLSGFHGILTNQHGD
jgi:hypothetical protein